MPSVFLIQLVLNHKKRNQQLEEILLDFVTTEKFHQFRVFWEAMAKYLQIIDKYWLRLGAEWHFLFFPGHTA